MGIIKEPAGVNFIVDPTPISETERQRISEIIKHYKKTGKRKFKKEIKAKTVEIKRKPKKELV